MTDEEHLKILQQGVATWNKWREENPEVPNLCGANLTRADLSWENLIHGALTGDPQGGEPR
jgi:hypothetical protein